MLTILLIVLLVLAFAGLPMYPGPPFHPYGWGPSGGLLVIVLLLALLLIWRR
jgi:hypothetical protein